MTETLIVVPLNEAGQAVAGDVVHRLFRPEAFQSIPYEGTACCGVTGVVYAKGGPFANLPDCPECLAPVAACRPGSTTGYNDGCRCTACRDAMRAYRRNWYIRALHPSRRCSCGNLKAPLARTCRSCYSRRSATHGTDSLYARGCRCEPCRAAHSVAMADYRQRVAA